MDDKSKVDVGDAIPTSLRHVIGQRRVTDQVAVALDAAFTDGLSMPHSLLTGPPGVGKSTLARIVATEMASTCFEVLGQSIRNSADLNALLLAARDRDVIHIDECHELSHRFQTALYLSLDLKKVMVRNDGTGRMPTGIPLRNFTLLLSTTDEHSLLQPLRDRMRLTLRFDFYSTDELILLLKQAVASLGWLVVESVLPHIADRARGTPRLALRLLQSARRVSRADGQATITETHLTRACELEETDALGLGPIDRRYLQIVAGGATRLNVISSMLGLHPMTLTRVTEPFLIRSGLLMKDDESRRVLTALGHEHLRTEDARAVSE